MVRAAFRRQIKQTVLTRKLFLNSTGKYRVYIRKVEQYCYLLFISKVKRFVRNKGFELNVQRSCDSSSGSDGRLSNIAHPLPVSFSTTIQRKDKNKSTQACTHCKQQILDVSHYRLNLVRQNVRL